MNCSEKNFMCCEVQGQGHSDTRVQGRLHNDSNSHGPSNNVAASDNG